MFFDIDAIGTAQTRNWFHMEIKQRTKQIRSSKIAQMKIKTEGWV